jgi:hypothetical protein
MTKGFPKSGPAATALRVHRSARPPLCAFTGTPCGNRIGAVEND